MILIFYIFHENYYAHYAHMRMIHDHHGIVEIIRMWLINKSIKNYGFEITNLKSN